MTPRLRTEPHRPRRAPRVRQPIPWRTFVAVFIATVLVDGGTTTAAAVWTAPTVALGGTANAATASVALGGTADLAAAYQFTGTGFSNAPKALTLANTGSSPLALALSVAALTPTPAGATLAAAVQVTLWAGSAGACAATAPATGTSVGTFAALPALPVGTSSAAGGQSVTLCVITRLTTTVAAHQGESVSVALRLTGTVGAWSAQATAAAFAQSVYRVGAPVVTCTPVAPIGLALGYAALSWPAVSGATSYSVILSNGTTLRTISSTSGTPPLYRTDIGVLNLPLLSPNVTVTIRASDPVYGTTNDRIVPLTYSGLLGVGCG